jgi:hypothetical protein
MASAQLMMKSRGFSEKPSYRNSSGWVEYPGQPDSLEN